MMSKVSELSLAGQGRAIVEQRGGRWTDDRGMCRCPGHDDRTPSLSVRVGHSRLLYRCFAGCATGDVLRALDDLGLACRTEAREPQETRENKTHAQRTEFAIRVWGGGRPLVGSPAARYLAGRRLATGSPELRYHPRTPHGARPFTRFRPALLAAVRDETGIVAVHRTFLDPRRGSAANLPSPKCALGSLGRGAVRLGGIAPTIGLAEGIETALSVSALFGVPCWATLGTERFRHVALPAQVRELLLFLDNDAGGRRAEMLARESFVNLTKIEARFPRRAGADWNDVLRDLGGPARR